jgi:hypothetical protein
MRNGAAQPTQSPLQSLQSPGGVECPFSMWCMVADGYTCADATCGMNDPNATSSAMKMPNKRIAVSLYNPLAPYNFGRAW